MFKRFLAGVGVFVICVPMVLVFTLIALFARPFIKSALKDARQLWRLIGRFISNLYKYSFRPWRKKQAEIRREKQLQKLRVIRSREKSSRAKSSRTTRDWWVKDSDFEYVDGLLVFSLMWNLVYSTVSMYFMVIGAVSTLAGYFGVWASYGPATQLSKPRTKEAVVYQPQIADQQEADFGPWHNRGEVFDQVGDLSFKQIALLSDTGSVKYSTHLEGNLRGFESKSSERVRRASVLASGQIQFEDQHRNVFIINPDQVFLVENYKAFAFVFDAHAKLSTVPLAELTTKEVSR